MSSIKQRWNIAAGKPYTKNGEEKKQWIRCGRAVQWDDGNIQIEIDAMPCFPSWDGKMSLFTPDDAKDSQPQRSQAPAQSRERTTGGASDNSLDGDIPFAPRGKRNHWE